MSTNTLRWGFASAAAILSAAGACRADGAALGDPSLRLDLSRGLLLAAMQPEKEAGAADGAKGDAPDVTAPTNGQPTATVGESAEEASAAPKIGFGRAGSQWFTVGAGYMNDFEDDHAGEVHVGYSRFIADEFEFNVELTGWYFVQEGQDTGAISPIMNLRWHFLHDEAYDWSVFGEFGFGMLFSFDNVPDGGTGFNFLPRLGAGFTKALDENTRLVLGVRWQHISNGRIEGDERNPGRDSIMLFGGVMFSF